MSNNCKLIAQNGMTQSQSQLCKGGYFKGASVTCGDHGQYVSMRILVFCVLLKSISQTHHSR